MGKDKLNLFIIFIFSLVLMSFGFLLQYVYVFPNKGVLAPLTDDGLEYLSRALAIHNKDLSLYDPILENFQNNHITLFENLLSLFTSKFSPLSVILFSGFLGGLVIIFTVGFLVYKYTTSIIKSIIGCFLIGILPLWTEGNYNLIFNTMQGTPRPFAVSIILLFTFYILSKKDVKIKDFFYSIPLIIFLFFWHKLYAIFFIIILCFCFFSRIKFTYTFLGGLFALFPFLFSVIFLKSYFSSFYFTRMPWRIDVLPVFIMSFLILFLLGIKKASKTIITFAKQAMIFSVLTQILIFLNYRLGYFELYRLAYIINVILLIEGIRIFELKKIKIKSPYFISLFFIAILISILFLGNFSTIILKDISFPQPKCWSNQDKLRRNWAKGLYSSFDLISEKDIILSDPYLGEYIRSLKNVPIYVSHSQFPWVFFPVNDEDNKLAKEWVERLSKISLSFCGDMQALKDIKNDFPFTKLISIKPIPNLEKCNIGKNINIYEATCIDKLIS